MSAWTRGYGVGVVLALSALAASAQTVPVTKQARPGAVGKRPALSISNVVLKPTDDGFMVTFGYRNSGTAPLPKSSEMPVKPSFSVLIDGREVNRGSLIIPAFPAEPGWQVETSYGCEIKNQPGELPKYGDPNEASSQIHVFNMNWTIGSFITVKINENKVGGMAADSQTYNLKQMALNYAHDVIVSDVSVDWAKGILSVKVRVDGQTQGYRYLYVHNRQLPWPFVEYVELVPGQSMYTIDKKFGGLRDVPATHGEIWSWLTVKKVPLADMRDIDHRNNIRPFKVSR